MIDQFFHSEVFSKVARGLDVQDHELSSALRKAKDAYESARKTAEKDEPAEPQKDDKLADLPVLLRGVSRRLRDLPPDVLQNLAWTAGQVVHDHWDEGIEGDDDDWLTQVQDRVQLRLVQVSESLSDLEALASEALKTPFFAAAGPEDRAVTACVKALKDFWVGDLGRSFPSRDNFTRVEGPDEVQSIPDFGSYLVRLFDIKANGKAEDPVMVPKTDAAKFLTLCVGLINHKLKIDQIYSASIRAALH